MLDGRDLSERNAEESEIKTADFCVNCFRYGSGQFFDVFDDQELDGTAVFRGDFDHAGKRLRQRLDLSVRDIQHVLQGVVDGADQTVDDRQLQNQRQAAHRHGVRPLAGVQRLRFLLDLLLVAGILLLDLAHLGLQPLHFRGAFLLFDRHGQHQDARKERQQNERKAVVADPLVQRAQQKAEYTIQK